MPRRLRDKQLDNRTARLRLKSQGKPHWRRLDRRLHLGYRRLKSGSGTWVARYYDGTRYHERGLGAADDAQEANAASVLTFSQAQAAAKEWYATEARKAAGSDALECLTVGDCLDRYLAWYEQHRKAISQVRAIVEAHIRPSLGDLLVNDLSPALIRQWHESLAKAPPRLRSTSGLSPNQGMIEGSGGRRKRKVSANRVLTTLRAALNRAYHDGEVESDSAWRPVRGFRGVEKSRPDWLDHDQARRLLNACEPDFSSLVRAALLAGARYGELIRLQVFDYQPEAQAIQIRDAKSGKGRTVFLNSEGVAHFEQLAAGREGTEIMLLRGDGTPWKKSHQHRRMRAACQIAKIEPAVGFHALRHSYASLYVQSGGTLVGLAASLGHADLRMVSKHYGHLSSDWRAREASEHAPSFATKAGTTVVSIRRGRGGASK